MVHPDDATRRADEFGGEEGHVPGPASRVEDLHALFDAGVLEKAPGEGAVEPVLCYQAPGLGLAAAHQVGGRLRAGSFGGHRDFSSPDLRLLVLTMGTFSAQPTRPSRASR